MTNKTSTRDRLLACARDLYLTEGMVGLSMRKVAQRENVSALAIYRHFDSKEALPAAVRGGLCAVCRVPVMRLVKCGHYFPLEVPDQLNPMIHRFLELSISNEREPR